MNTGSSTHATAHSGPPARGTAFSETMVGTLRLDGEDRTRRTRLDLTVSADRVLRLLGTTEARATGRIRVAGWADAPDVEGELEISPLARRRIRYRVDFTADGRRLTLDGWKSVTPRRPVTSMTVLPYTLLEDGVRIGTGTLRFPLATQLLPFLAGFRFPRREDGAEFLRPRWRGEPGRTEVWYTTVTDPATGAGLWLHHELTAPDDGSEPYAHGWAAVFPKDGPVRHARFGPTGWRPRETGFGADGVEVRPGRLSGSADGGALRWDLAEQPTDGPLFTFPRWAWRRPLLPAAQMLPAARARYDGTFTHDGETLILSAAPGASARIYGHGNARRWAWLHADLGGGDVLEIVAAVSMRPGLRRLPRWSSSGCAGTVAPGRAGPSGPRPAGPEGTLPCRHRAAHLDRRRPQRAAPGPGRGHPARGPHPLARLHRPRRPARDVPQQRARRRARPAGTAAVRRLAHRGRVDPRRNRPRGGGHPMSLAGLVSALIADDAGADWTRRVPARLETTLAALPFAARAGVRAAARGMDAYAVVRTGRTLGALTAPERESVLAELAARPGLQPLLDVLKVPVLMAAGTERMLQDGPAPRALPRADPPLDLTPASEWPARSTADAVVIGSGAGGATAARTLARAGLDVVVLEEGRHHSTESFGRRPPLDRFTELYRDGGATIALGRPPLLLPVGRAVGGTTVVNSGTCYRTPDHVLTRWSEDFGFRPADGFDRYLDEAERALKVAVQPLDVLGNNGRLTLAGARELGWRAAPLRRNAPGCRGSCQCVVGCPTGAKQSVQLSVLPDACAAGARIVTGARVERVLVDADRPGGPRAAGVRVRRDDGAFEILAPLVVVAGAPCSPPSSCAAPASAGTRASVATSASTRPRASPDASPNPSPHGRACCRASAWRSTTRGASSSRPPPPRPGWAPSSCPDWAPSCAANWRAPTGSPRSAR
nr:GMC family oxidoreductase N-terminal domain-containing protein [Streptomyces sp. HUAS 14-6]